MLWDHEYGATALRGAWLHPSIRWYSLIVPTHEGMARLSW